MKTIKSKSFTFCEHLKKSFFIKTKCAYRNCIHSTNIFILNKNFLSQEQKNVPYVNFHGVLGLKHPFKLAGFAPVFQGLKLEKILHFLGTLHD